jgi:hypothetical protein
MTTPKGINRALVTLNLPKPVPALIKYGRAIVTAMTGNANFQNVEPALAAVTAAIDELATGTLQAKTTILGLTPGATVTFRYRGVTKTGEGDWSQLVTVIVK